MIARKQKLRIIQASLLLLGIIIIFLTYLSKDKDKEQVIIPKSTQEKIKKQLDQEKKQEVDVFYNIEYSGLDLSGNRYILKSKEALSDKSKKESAFEIALTFINGWVLLIAIFLKAPDFPNCPFNSE